MKCRRAHGITLVYDITNKASFLEIREWLDQIQHDVDEDVTYILIGNKCDLEEKREVTYEEGKQCADELGIEFIETSALRSINVDEAYRKLAFKILQKVVEKQEVGEKSGKLAYS